MEKNYNFHAYRSLHKKYQYVILQRNGRIRILTPIPYILDFFDRENVDDVIYIYNEDVKFLYNCLKLLEIPEKEAKEKKYALNQYTGDELYLRALNNDKISNELSIVIFKHNWI